MQGFAPARRGTFVSAKVPKTISARARPLWGAWSTAPNKMAQELAALKQPSPRSRFGAAAQPRTKALKCKDNDAKRLLMIPPISRGQPSLSPSENLTVPEVRIPLWTVAIVFLV